MDNLYIIKIGGNIIDDDTKLERFLDGFASVAGKKILVHGGGKLATRLAEQMGIPQQLVDGRRITDAETLRVVTMVYAGSINKNIVALLQARGANAFGLTGADGNSIRAHKRMNAAIDYGFAGDVDQVNGELLTTLLDTGLTLVFAPITHDREGQLLNTNADTIAQELGRSLSAAYSVSLIYSFEKPGVLMDASDDNTVIPAIDPVYYEQLKAEGRINEGMIPKMDNAFRALKSGVSKVIIGDAMELDSLILGTAGTTISINETSGGSGHE